MCCIEWIWALAYETIFEGNDGMNDKLCKLSNEDYAVKMMSEKQKYTH